MNFTKKLTFRWNKNVKVEEICFKSKILKNKIDVKIVAPPPSPSQDYSL
mgnify:CR=1 FL=1